MYMQIRISRVSQQSQDNTVRQNSISLLWIYEDSLRESLVLIFIEDKTYKQVHMILRIVQEQKLP